MLPRNKFSPESEQIRGLVRAFGMSRAEFSKVMKIHRNSSDGWVSGTVDMTGQMWGFFLYRVRFDTKNSVSCLPQKERRSILAKNIEDNYALIDREIDKLNIKFKSQGY